MLRKTLKTALLVSFVFGQSYCYAADPKTPDSKASADTKAKGGADDDEEFTKEMLKEEKKEEKGEPSSAVAASTKIRRFHSVLDELLAEFGYDIKLGQFKDLKNIAIRRVEVSDALPDTYKDYVKLLVSERLRDNTNVPIINCIPCSSRTSKMVEGKIVITSPVTDANELKTAAERLGIENFMDVVLIYHTTHMVLAFQVFRMPTNELVWTRTYNSETIKSRYQKLAIDYSQVAKSRVSDEYKPDYRLLMGVGGANLPNLSGDTNDNAMLVFAFRGTERFDNRRTEFGLLLSIQATLSQLMSSYPTTGKPASTTTTTSSSDQPTTASAFKYSFGLYAIYAHNFLGAVESYDQVRQGITVGLGGTLALGYIAPTARLGWDMYFGRRFVLSIGGVYIGPSKILVGGEFIPTSGGAGVDAVLSLNY